MTPTDPALLLSDTPLLPPSDEAAEKKAKKDKEKKKKKKASKGIETMYRTTLANHLRLSEMADKKANLMISINAILVSIIMSSFFKPVGGMERLLVPEIMQLVVSLGTVLISLFATKPNYAPPAKVSAGDRPLDLLFFGDYTRLSAAEYREAVRDLTSDEKRLYESLSNNIYAQGKVLHKKYRLLTIAYTFFMVGFSLVVVTSVITLLLTK